jgi:hypothetical protein
VSIRERRGAEVAPVCFLASPAPLVSAVEAVVGFVVVVGVLVIAVFLAMPLKCGERQAQER